MQIAIISDIHGNLEALKAVMADIRRWKPQAVYSLGDNIGYGPDPGPVIEMLHRQGISSVRGNHELAAVKPRFKNWFNPVARLSIEKTIEVLKAADLETIGNFPPLIRSHGCRFVHGFPPQSSLIYQFQVADPKKCRLMGRIQESICFVGHTHTLELMSIRSDQLDHQDLAQGSYHLDRSCKHIINIGSVGQPRDGNLDAKYVLFNPENYHLQVRFVSYDATVTVEKMRRLGWPEKHAARLLPAA